MFVKLERDGDMGAGGPVTRSNEIEFTIKIVAQALRELRHHGCYSYGVKFHPDDIEFVKAMLNKYRSHLMPGVEFYSCSGREIFEMRGAAGGIVSSNIFYLITREDIVNV